MIRSMFLAGLAVGLLACAGSGRDREKRGSPGGNGERGGATRPDAQSQPAAGEPSAQDPGLRAEPVFAPAGLGIPDDIPDPALPSPEPAPVPAPGGETPEGPGVSALPEFLTSMQGVRLPHSAVATSLDTVVRDAERTVPVPSPLAGDINEFVREIVISVSKKEVSVNEYRAARITCTAGKKGTCDDDFPRRSEKRVYRVRPEDLSRGETGAYIIDPLVKTLASLQRSRAAVLKGLSPRVADWLMSCDAYTLAVDRDVSFGVAARVIHSAGFADLTRVRLVVTDENESLAYIALLPPRLTREQLIAVHVVGDSWWREAGATAGLDAAYLVYSASLDPEDFSGFASPVLPACLPMEIAWERVLDDPTYARVAAHQLESHIADLTATYGAVFGLSRTAPGSAPSGTSGASTEPGAAPTGPLPRFAGPDGHAAVDVIGPTPRSGALEKKPAEAGPKMQRPYLFIGETAYTLVLEGQEGVPALALAIPREDPAKLHEHLAGCGTLAVSVSAADDLPMDSFVRGLDAVRYRCAVTAMSGRCKRYDPVLPTIHLFATPSGTFVPAAAGEPLEDVPANP